MPEVQTVAGDQPAGVQPARAQLTPAGVTTPKASEPEITSAEQSAYNTTFPSVGAVKDHLPVQSGANLIKGSFAGGVRQPFKDFVSCLPTLVTDHNDSWVTLPKANTRTSPCLDRLKKPTMESLSKNQTGNGKQSR